MRVFIFFVVIISIPLYSAASSVPKVEVERQTVMVWNNVNSDTLTKIDADLKDLCEKDMHEECIRNNISTYLSMDRSTIFYEIDFKYIEDISVIYAVTEDQLIVSKSWASIFTHPFVKKVPFARPEK